MLTAELEGRSAARQNCRLISQVLVRSKPLPSPQQNIDSYLGRDSYQGWMDEKKYAQEEKARAERLARTLNVSLSDRTSLTNPLLRQLSDDVDLLDTLGKDLQQGMNLVAAGKRPSPKEQLEGVYALYGTAASVVEQMNDILEAIQVTGLFAIAVKFPFMLFQLRAKETLEALNELIKELKEAKTEVHKAEAKAAIDVILHVAEALAPELSLTARAGIYLFDVVKDKALGPDHPTKGQRYTGDVVPGVEQFGEAVHEIEEYGEKTRSVAKKLGKTATVATFYIDYKEIAEGRERVEKLENATEKLHESYEALMKVIKENAPRQREFEAAFERAIRAIEEVRQGASNARGVLEDEMRKSRYRSPVAWKIAS